MNLRVIVLVPGMLLLAQAGFSQTLPIDISAQPVELNLGRGSEITFQANWFTSTRQWLHNGVPIPGATSSFLTLTNIQASDAGIYKLVTQVESGEQTSSNATLVVGPVTTLGPAAGRIPIDLTNASAIAVGQYHTIALRPDGRVAAWGSANNAAAIVPPTATNVIAVAAGQAYSLALRADGRVVAWGESEGAIVPESATNVVAIAAGYQQSIALHEDGKVTAWGYQYDLRTGSPPWPNDVLDISASETYSMAVRANGTVYFSGSTPTLPGNFQFPSNVISAAAGKNHFLLLTSNGSVVAAGANYAGQTNVPAGLTNVVAIAAGYDTSYALRQDGTLVGWGATPTVPSGLVNVSAISAKETVASALSGDGAPVIVMHPRSLCLTPNKPGTLRARAVGAGTLSYQWFLNGSAINGATNADLVLAKVTENNAGRYHVVVTNSIGQATSRAADVRSRPWRSVAVWGLNSGLCANPMPESTEFTQISAGLTHAVGLTPEGNAVCWGNPSEGKCDVPPEATNLVYVAAGKDYSVGLNASGLIVGWGATNSIRPAKTFREAQMGSVTLIKPFVDAYGFAALTHSGIGYVYDGALWPISSFNGIKTIAAGKEHLLGLRTNGTVIAWSRRTYSALPTPSDLTNITRIAAGSYHSVALRSDGSVVCWGPGVNKISTPPDLTNVVEVAAGAQWSLAETADGRLVSWGMEPVDPESFSSLLPSNIGNITGLTMYQQYAMALATNRSPVITKHPRSRAVPTGWPAQFQCWASGEPPLSFQWELNGVPIPGATSRNLIITNFGLDLGEYQVVVTNNFGCTTSHVAKLATGNVFAWGKEEIDESWVPYSATNCLKISASANHSAALLPGGRIQAWGGIDAGDAPILNSMTGVQDFNCGSDGGFALLSDGSCRIWTSFLETTNIPTTKRVISGDIEYEGRAVAALEDGSVLSWGTTPSFYWGDPSLSNAVSVSGGYHNGVALKADGTAASFERTSSRFANYILDAVQVQGAGLDGYALRAGKQAVSLRVLELLATNVVSISGGNLDCLALREDGTVVLLGAGSDSDKAVVAALSNVVEIAAGHQHKVIRFGNGSPHITVNPFSRPVLAGTNALLTTLAVGAQPMSYQWQKNGIDLLGQTNSSLLLTQAQLATAGDYRCIVSNSLGSETGKVASVSVVFPPPSLVPSANSVTTDGFKFSVGNLSAQGPLVIYSSTNLVDWQPIWTNPPGPNAIEFIDPAVTNSGTKYYRASELR